MLHEALVRSLRKVQTNAIRKEPLTFCAVWIQCVTCVLSLCCATEHQYELVNC